MTVHSFCSGFARLLMVGLCALSVAGCANKETSPDGASLGPDGKGPVVPGTPRDFSSDLTPEAQTTLAKQAQWLKQYPAFTITVEGHADERGTREYNIALGARRATAVRTYLASAGIPAARMRTISYGKERPVAVCDDISCWAQNRRAQTVLNSRVAS
jgi:peptidoglycan-associated lipoprotein